jgi:hypothetical protein
MGETLSVILCVVGFVGMLGNIIRMFSTMTYETTRPWAGLQKRARTKKDGSTYVQTYYSKGPAATKAKLKGHWSFWVFFFAFWAGLLGG